VKVKVFPSYCLRISVVGIDMSTSEPGGFTLGGGEMLCQHPLVLPIGTADNIWPMIYYLADVHWCHFWCPVPGVVPRSLIIGLGLGSLYRPYWIPWPSAMGVATVLEKLCQCRCKHT
jgi:hypothetical protein